MELWCQFLWTTCFFFSLSACQVAGHKYQQWASLAKIEVDSSVLSAQFLFGRTPRYKSRKTLEMFEASTVSSFLVWPLTLLQSFRLLLKGLGLQEVSFRLFIQNKRNMILTRLPTHFWHLISTDSTAKELTLHLSVFSPSIYLGWTRWHEPKQYNAAIKHTINGSF